MRRGEASSTRNDGWSENNGAVVHENGNHHEPIPLRSRPAAVPGRPRKRMPPTSSPASGGAPTKKKKKKKTFCQRFYHRWIGGKKRSTAQKNYLSLLFAVVLWYLLGVVSIGTSKLLLMPPKHHHDFVGNVPPLYLTLQQLLMGSWFFRFLLNMNAFGSAGLQPWPLASSKTSKSQTATTARHSSLSFLPKSWLKKDPDVVLAGLFFALGFLTTNYSFHKSSAAFVETIKAAEPITSAAVAVSWGIETLGGPEVLSLSAIVMGVLISTLANGSEPTTTVTSSASSSSLSSSIQSCLLVMTTNLCFSFRGLHQKLFRASPQGTVAVVDDLNLQYRMQQVGVVFLLVPAILWEGPSMVARVWRLYWNYGLIQSGVLFRYFSLSLINGFAFASYNLASTFILTRISVVHHAALNCIRRIFAIVVTSIYFGIPITWLGAFGILISFVGFMAFTHYKVKRQREPRPLSSLLPMSAV